MESNNTNEEIANAMIDMIDNMMHSNRLIRDINMVPFPESNINAFGNYIGLNNILQHSIEDAKPVYKNVISDDGKEKLENLIYSSDMNVSDLSCNICPITQEDFKDGDEIVKLPCGHYFNKISILEWLENIKAECPICRHNLPSKEIKLIEKISETTTANMSDEEDTNAIVEDENDLLQNLIYTQLSRRLIQPTGAIINNNITHNYLSRNIQYMHNDEDDLELQTMLFQSLYASQDVSGN